MSASNHNEDSLQREQRINDDNSELSLLNDNKQVNTIFNYEPKITQTVLTNDKVEDTLDIFNDKQVNDFSINPVKSVEINGANAVNNNQVNVEVPVDVEHSSKNRTTNSVCSNNVKILQTQQCLNDFNKELHVENVLSKIDKYSPDITSFIQSESVPLDRTQINETSIEMNPSKSKDYLPIESLNTMCSNIENRPLTTRVEDSIKKLQTEQVQNKICSDVSKHEVQRVEINNDNISKSTLVNQMVNNNNKFLQTELIYVNAHNQFENDKNNTSIPKNVGNVDNLKTSSNLNSDKKIESINVNLCTDSLLTNKLKNERLSIIPIVDIKVDSLVDKVESKKRDQDDGTINLSNEEFLQISKNLYTRDILLYEKTYINNELNIEQEKKKIEQSSQLDLCEKKCLENTFDFEINELIHRTEETNKNKLFINSDVALCEKKCLEDAFDSKVKSELSDQARVINEKELLITSDVASSTKETNENIVLTNLVSVCNENSLSMPIASGKSVQEDKNDLTVQTANEQTNVIEEKLLNSKVCSENVDKSLIMDQTIKTEGVSALVNNELNIDSNKNNKIKIEKISSTDNEFAETEFKNTSNRADKSNVIDKLQTMNWLKSNSATSDNMNSNKKNEKSDNYFVNTKKDFNSRRHQSHIKILNKTQNEKLKNLNSKIKKEDSKQNNKEKESNVQQKDATVWNDNTGKKLFPNAQGTVIDREKEEEELDKAVIASICTAQLESERRKASQTHLRIEVQKEDDNEWGKIHRNLPDDPQIESVSGGDSNNNPYYGKGFVDRYGRVDGYAEKRLFMGKGARKKEQELLKAHSENRPNPQQNSAGSIRVQASVNKSAQQLDCQTHSGIKKESTLNKSSRDLVNNDQSAGQYKKEIEPSKNKERPIHGRADKEVNLSVSDVSLTKNEQKSVFHDEVKKIYNENQKVVTQRDNQITANKGQETIKKNQSQIYRQQNYSDMRHNSTDKRYESVNKNQEYFNKQQNNFDKYQDHFKRNQNFNAKNQDRTCKNQDQINKNENFSVSKDTNTNKKNLDRNFETAVNKDQLKKTQNSSERNFDSTNTDQDHYVRNKTCFDKDEDTKITQNRFYKNQTEENWDEDEKHIQESKLTNICNKQINSHLQNRNADTNKKYEFPLPNNSIKDAPSKQEQNRSENSLHKVRPIVSHSATTATVEIKNEQKQDVNKQYMSVSYGSVPENLTMEPKTNVLMTFEGNDNIRHTKPRGFNPSRFDSAQLINHRMKDKSNQSVLNLSNSANSLPYVNSSIIQNESFPAPVSFESFNPSSAMLNVNAVPFETTNRTIDNQMKNQYSVESEHDMLNSLFGFTLPSINNFDQVRINEISSCAQEVMKYFNLVSSLANQLSIAQAGLLQAQARCYSLHGMNPLNYANLTPVTDNQMLQRPNSALPPDLMAMRYSSPPNLPVSINSIQNTPAGAQPPPKSSSPVNIQEFINKCHSQTALQEQLNAQNMYRQQNHLFHQQAVNFQQYSANASAVNAIPRGRIPHSTDCREIRQ